MTQLVLPVDVPFVYVVLEIEEDIIEQGVAIIDRVLKVAHQAATLKLSNLRTDTIVLDEVKKVASLYGVDREHFLHERPIPRPCVSGWCAHQFTRVLHEGHLDEFTVNAVIIPHDTSGVPLRPARPATVRSWLLFALVICYLCAGLLVGATTVCNCTTAPTVGVVDYSDYARCRNLATSLLQPVGRSRGMRAPCG